MKSKYRFNTACHQRVRRRKKFRQSDLHDTVCESSTQKSTLQSSKAEPAASKNLQGNELADCARRLGADQGICGCGTNGAYSMIPGSACD